MKSFQFFGCLQTNLDNELIKDDPRELKLDGALGQEEICNYLKNENISKSFLSHILVLYVLVKVVRYLFLLARIVSAKWFYYFYLDRIAGAIFLKLDQLFVRICLKKAAKGSLDTKKC